MTRGKFIRCQNRLEFMGYTKEQALILCAGQFFESEDNINVDFVDGEKEKIDDDEGCMSRKIPIFKKEHPDWSHDHVVAAAAGYCRQKKKEDAIKGVKERVELKEVGRARNISLSKVATLVHLIKTKKGMKVGGMGALPFKTELQMKNVNRLQTKLEKLFTEEQKWLTMEELLKRNRYMTLMKKDSDETAEVEDSLGDMLYDFVLSMKETYPSLNEEAILLEFVKEGTVLKDSYWVSQPVEMERINDGLKNIIKVPVILAREMVQPYKDGAEKHFKPYNELSKSIEGIDKIPIIIEHQDNIGEHNTVGYVKLLKTDDEIRGIRGTAILTEGRLPKEVRVALKQGIVVPVSIGFFASLGDSGTFEGQEYDHSQEDIILHHLAICIQSTARCPTGYCGLNLDSMDGDKEKQITILNKGNYYINICELFRDSQINNKVKEENSMEKDSFKFEIGKKDVGIAPGDTEPKDLEAILTPLREFMAGMPIKNAKETMSRILKAFKELSLMWLVTDVHIKSLYFRPKHDRLRACLFSYP